MGMPVTQITSNNSIPVELPFRISAGPGAGKTHWLINHIKNVLHNSNRFSKTRKIACITYTNVATEIIIERLGASVDRVEVSTIHSFLYRHIVKPFVSFIADEYSLDVYKMDGHDDIILSSYSFLNDWKTRTQQQRIRDDQDIVKAFSKAHWRLDNSNNLIIKPDYPMKANGYAIKNDSYLTYKKMTWERGLLHHDDVLFFSYLLISRFPFILQVLRAKFPYFFVDEFQDTNPIQTKIMEQIGKNETIIGIIGDEAQSIYGFQGADHSQFHSFTLPNIAEYKMIENRRSTDTIINFLRIIRPSLVQKGVRNVAGEKPLFLKGTMTKALAKSYEIINSQNIYSLSRDNITSNAMKRSMDYNIPTTDLFQKLYENDSNGDRRRIVASCIKATELAKNKRFRDAIKELERNFKFKDDKLKGKKEALKFINYLLNIYNEYKDKSLYDFYLIVKKDIKQGISELTNRGNVKPFYENHTYQQLAVCVKIIEDTSYHRTIHKAKGAEFDNVLLILNDEKDLDFIFNPNLDNNEEHRINYVAVSRAVNRLFINIPNLSSESQTIIKDKGFDIKSLES